MSTNAFLLRFVVPILGGLVIAYGLMAIGCPFASLVSNLVTFLTFGVNMLIESIGRFRFRSD